MFTLRTFIEDRLSLVHRPQLHGVEVHLLVVALRTGLLDDGVLVTHILDLIIHSVQPVLASCGGGGGGDFSDSELVEVALKGAGSAHDLVVHVRRVENSAALRAKGPSHLARYFW